jgi:hypothetical protein
MFHPDLSYEIVRMRHGELVAAAQAASGRRRIFDRLRSRRRRSAPDADRTAAPENDPQRHLIAVPPPRPDRDHPSRDPRVA